jgi:carboxypeptidase PM20D1
MMKKSIRFLLALIIVFLIIIVLKTMTFKSLQIKTEPAILVDFGKESVSNLSKAISFPTISYAINSPIDTIAFLGYHNFLSEAYPLIKSKLKKEVFSEFSILYTWEGKNPALKPVILMAHMDVVPVGEANSWEKKPFSGENDGTFIWGRGTLDDKVAMISILEAVERLIEEGFQPERTILLSFGHDEELIGSQRGAKMIADTLKQRGIYPEFVLDEGMAVTVGMVPMIKSPVALIGISEKGNLSVKLTAELPGGHSSTPEKESAITLISKAITRLSENQMKPDISGPVDDFIRFIGPEMPYYAKVIFANKWIFKGLIINIYTGSASGNALVRTTTAPAIINAGIKDNVIPEKAEAVINFRILPGETSKDVVSHIIETIDDNRIKTEILNGMINEPAPVSPTKTLGFNWIMTTLGQIYPEAVVAPTMMLGGSDSKYFSSVTQNIYRFEPIVVTSEDMARIHGVNERNKISDFNRGINFYYNLLKNIDK